MRSARPRTAHVPRSLTWRMTTLRPLRPSDAAALVPLCEQLGYPATAEQLERRVRALGASDDHGLLGAVGRSGALIGWIHVQGHRTLAAEPYAEITGLVVDERCRSAGVGQGLVAGAEAWARAHGYTVVRVRSNVVRSDAHRFYERLGYRRQKSQHVFDKTLSSPSSLLL